MTEYDFESSDSNNDRVDQATHVDGDVSASSYAGMPTDQASQFQVGPSGVFPREGYSTPPYEGHTNPQSYYGQPVGPTVQPVQTAVEQKKSRAWIVAIVAIVACMVVVLFGAWSCTSWLAMPFNEFSYYEEDSAIDSLDEDAVAVITMSGTIQYDGTECSPEGLKLLLDQAEENRHVKAVVLRVDSGGGVATAGEEMTEYLKDFSKPVVVSSASMNASAAYEISSQADYIYVAKTTMIGSIGTAIELTDYSGLLEKLGINIETITSSESKDSSYGNRPLTSEERKHYQEMVNQVNETFIAAVAEGRDMSVEEVRKLATGMTFTGLTAIENGLADEVGTQEDAVVKAAELAGISNYTTVDLASDMYMDDLMSLFGYRFDGDALAGAIAKGQSVDALTR